MFMGLTIATVVGVPLAAWAGDVLGWRASFWAIAGIGLIVMAALRLTLPKLRRRSAATPWRRCASWVAAPFCRPWP